jgi:hypothetical protein
VLAASAPQREVICAGLVARDLRRFGGHRVEQVARVVARLRGEPFTLVHVGGEILTCDAFAAAVMLQRRALCTAAIDHLERSDGARAAWVRRTLGTRRLAPYVLGQEDAAAPARIVHHAVGGFDLERRDPALRAEVAERLRQADRVTVRDRLTLAALRRAGVSARLAPDAAFGAARACAARIDAARQGRALAALRGAFCGGWIAAQFGAEFGDDATLEALTQQLGCIAAASGCGIVLFRAGAAPWHDDLGALTRVARGLPRGRARVFGSLRLWDIAALIADAKLVVSSSLHVRIVAMACGVPRVGLRPPGRPPGAGKHGAVAAAWELPGMPKVVDVARAAAAARRASEVPAAALAALAADLASRHAQVWREVGG